MHKKCQKCKYKNDYLMAIKPWNNEAVMVFCFHNVKSLELFREDNYDVRFDCPLGKVQE
jgi:hypothetical protein